ncbi:hypothetical protein [Tsukamurella pulmonis]|uniref:hypothetical protein n=1 Tax=Tsukamurella pulmonis TaxID=47312 RepID=UPI000E098020|nr:hypothetical protein [Tsukamurella pulmonis]RDH12616.1 hypothetical protein DVB88_06640 [Tsukamurella pulmonis]
MNVIPFGRTPAERRRNAESAERAETKPRHPAGSKRPLTYAELQEAAALEPDWRSKYPSRPEARRANLLAASTCKVCERKFAHGTAVPADRVCRDCRHDMHHNGPQEPPADPSLF